MNSYSIPLISFKQILEFWDSAALCLSRLLLSSLPLFATRIPPLLFPNTFVPVYNPLVCVSKLTTHYPDKPTPVRAVKDANEKGREFKNLSTQVSAMYLTRECCIWGQVDEPVGGIFGVRRASGHSWNHLCVFCCKTKATEVFKYLSGILISILSQLCNFWLKVHFQNQNIGTDSTVSHL